MNSPSAAVTPSQLLGTAGRIQLLSITIASTLSWWQSWSVGSTLIFASLLALLATWQSDLPRWWLAIQAAFMPTVAAVLSLQLPAWIFLAALLMLLVTYGRVFSSRVPLYLSGHSAIDALTAMMPAHKNFYFLDLGSGTGSVIRQLDQRFAFGMFHGVETAPLPFLWSWLLSRIGRAQYQVRYQDIWSTDLSGYDVVYAFLSPQPMADLWLKVQREMRPGSLFISNTFRVPGIEPSQTLALGDGLANCLYVWRLPEEQGESP